MDISHFHFKEPESTPIVTSWTKGAKIRLQVMRLDAIHPQVSGNKWFKLKENIDQALRLGKSGILTFGGIWSNHLAATAAATRILGLKSVGIVRALPEEESQYSLDMKQCQNNGMQLIGVSRTDYRRRYEADYLNNLQTKFPDYYLVPEGGNNNLGVLGCHEICQWIPDGVDVVCLAIGTGSTFAGIRQMLPLEKRMLGFGPFKKVVEQKQTILKNCPNLDKIQNEIFSDKVWGGFGRYNSDLIQFMNEFYEETGVPTDLIYTAKMFYYLKQRILSGYFSEGTNILAIHTGGLQGNQSLAGRLIF